MPKKKFRQDNKIANWLNECPFNRSDIAVQLHVSLRNLNKYISDPELLNNKQMKAISWMTQHPFLQVVMACNKIWRAKEFSERSWFNESGVQHTDVVMILREDVPKYAGPDK